MWNEMSPSLGNLQSGCPGGEVFWVPLVMSTVTNQSTSCLPLCRVPATREGGPQSVCSSHVVCSMMPCSTCFQITRAPWVPLEWSLDLARCCVQSTYSDPVLDRDSVRQHLHWTPTMCQGHKVVLGIRDMKTRWSPWAGAAPVGEPDV